MIDHLSRDTLFYFITLLDRQNEKYESIIIQTAGGRIGEAST